MSCFDEIFKRLKETSGMSLKLDAILAADAALGSPSQRFRSIHVAGTNGKGTTSTKIAHTLTSLGFKTGLFTSPHINSFRERVQIDGKMISEEDALKELKIIQNTSTELTFFETLTLLAFLYFNKNGVDYAVFETGLGGEKDATNILKPEVSVITNISKDHAHILGSTLDEISQAKAGIIKPYTPVVLGSRATRGPILKAAFEKQAPVYFVKKCDNWLEENTEIAKCTLKVLLSSEQINVSLNKPPCRFEEHEIEGQVVIFDVAHNEDGFLQLFEEMGRKYKNRKIFTIFSLCLTKDAQNIIPLIKEKSSEIFYYEGDHARLASYEDLMPHLQNAKRSYLDDFIQSAKTEGGVILVTGSFFIMGELQAKFGILEEKDLLLLCD